jgi:hypothetical protein
MLDDFRVLTAQVDTRRLSALIDFSYMHYALGDTLTKLVNLACQAEETGCTGIDLYISVHPYAPAAPSQGFIVPDNYLSHMDNLFPAFLCTPQLRSVRLLRDGGITMGQIVETLLRSKAPMWPSAEDHFHRRMPYPLDHHKINAFFAKHGRIPNLDAPRGYAAWARSFLDGHFPGKFSVCINPRQSRLTAMPMTTYRDAPIDEWLQFTALTAERHPDVQFFLLGGYSEWDRRFATLPNITIPRTLGLTLAHELALVVHSDMFMGTSSGFATMATFGRKPYLITAIEHVFAAFAGVPVGAAHYPFAAEGQTLMWQNENADQLYQYLQGVHATRSPLMQTSRKGVARS